MRAARRTDGLARDRAHRGVAGKRRSDIEGLRAVAILAVVAFHAGVPHVTGGYVGVDVFFVISGYLITDHLYREVSSTGRVSFADFYARRARRLLPAALLVVVATVAVSAAVLPPLEVPSVARDGMAAALYFVNYRFALQSTNYLAGTSTSPLLHYWSLGVEEQFYLLWPLLVLGFSLVWLHRRDLRKHTPRDGAPSRVPLAIGLSVVGLASLVASIWLTRADQPWAFFSLPTRAWELAAGALIALGTPAIKRLNRWSAASLGWLGLAAIVWSVVTLDSATPFPGTAALVPVLGAAAVIAAGARETPFGPVTALRAPPLQVLGRLSYTWYLWHWPALVLAPYVVGHPLSLGSKLAVAAGSLTVAGATTVLVERPALRWDWLVLRRGTTLGLSAGFGSVAVAACLVTSSALPSLVGTGEAAGARLTLPSGDLHVGPHVHLSRAELEAWALTREVHEDVLRSLKMTALPSDLSPSLESVASGYGMAVPFFDGCFDGFTDISVNPCEYGDVASSKTIVLYGDSHALMWFPAFEAIARSKHWRLVVQGKATCPPLDLKVFSPDLGEWYTQCEEWRAAVLRRMEEIRPMLVVLGFSREYGVANDHVNVYGPAWMRGLASMIRTIRSKTGAVVVVMGDVPYPTQVVPDCLSANLDDVAACEIPKQPPYVDVAGIGAEREVALSAGAGYINTLPWFCGPERCAVVIGNKVVYHDDNHLAASYASWLTPVIRADLRLEIPRSLWR